MRFTVLAVGRPRDRALAEAIAEYETRAARYWPLEIAEVKEEPARGATVEIVRKKEGERLEARAGDAVLVACDVRGTSFSSEAFAEWLQRSREGARDVALLIGGAYGLSSELRERAARTISLSPLTLPHEIARLVLAEQLYRAGTIVRGEPYHK